MAQFSSQYPTIQWAVLLGDATAVAAWLDHNPSLIHEHGLHGDPLLDHAVHNNKPEMARLLLERGANPNTRESKHGFAALHYAAVKHNRTALIKVLVECGANVNQVDNKGSSPLLESARSGSHDSLVYLIEKGADVKLADLDGNTALHWAAMNGYIRSVEHLVSCGAAVDAKNAKGEMALDFAEDEDGDAVVSFLRGRTLAKLEQSLLQQETSSVVNSLSTQTNHTQSRL